MSSLYCTQIAHHFEYWRKIEKQPTRWNEISVNFRGKVGHYRNGSLCYCFSLVGQHLYISSARKFNECQNYGYPCNLFNLEGCTMTATTYSSIIWT